MPIEPPVESPQTLGDAYALMASARHAPIAGGTDLMVQITGELGEPPERVQVAHAQQRDAVVLR
jgi:CO/xanthine dehydrogenase FAD-binding subunit